MYIGGTDSKGLHHLVSEVLDNCMDEAVAGFATKIDIELSSEEEISIFVAKPATASSMELSNTSDTRW